MKQRLFIQILFLSAGIILFQNCQTPKDNWIIKGNTSSQATSVYLFQMNGMLVKSLIDSAVVEKGKFTIEHGNSGDQMEAYAFDFDKDPEGAIEFIVLNGDHLKVNVKDEFNSEFSGTSIAKDFNQYNQYRNEAMTNLSEFSKVLSANKNNEDELNDKMLVFNEKMQDLENEKIDFLRSIQNPELNSFLILNEVISTGVIEKELFGKYVNALTAEGAMTNNGHKIHQMYEVIDAYALSREMDILDTATIRERYNKLNEVNKNSEFASQVQEYLTPQQ